MSKNNIPVLGKEQLNDLLKNNTKQKVCKTLDVSDRTLNKWILLHNLTDFIRNKTSCPPKEELEKYLQSHTLTEARNNYNVKKTTMDKWLEKLELKQDFQFDHGKMISLAKAAKEVGVSRTMASKWFKKNLIPGAKKVNSTRVVVPENAVALMKTLIRKKNGND